MILNPAAQAELEGIIRVLRALAAERQQTADALEDLLTSDDADAGIAALDRTHSLSYKLEHQLTRLGN